MVGIFIWYNENLCHAMSNQGSLKNRRTLLKSAGGIASIGLLAGCVGDEPDEDVPDDDDDPPEEDVDDEDPEETDDSDVDFPNQDVELIIPFGPGGGYDTYTRLLAPYLEKHLPGDHSVLPQNVEGAGGAIAANQVYNSDPDGHTIMIASITGFSLEQMFRDVDFDLEQMSYLAQIAFEPHMLGVGENTDLADWDDFVEAMQSDSPPQMYAPSPQSVDVAGPLLVGELGDLWAPDKVTENLVIYDSRGAAMQGIIAGDVQYMSTAYSSVLDFREDLEFPIIYSAEENKPDAVPDDTETLTSAGVPETIEGMVGTRRAFTGPPDIPDERLSILRSAFEDAINDDDFLAEAEEADRPINFADGEEIASIARDAIETWQANEEIIDILSE